ncbi:MAG: hypothetical protein WC494_02975 [Candidatus Pacearchaeota archaeon]
MLNKKAELTTHEILELILAIAGITVVAILLYNLISPKFNVEEKTAESYFNSFKESVETAEKGGTGIFKIWQPEKEVNYFLIYFGTTISYEKDSQEFFSIGENSNHICLCYTKDQETFCNYCENLKYPLKKDEQYNQFHLGLNEEVRIIKLPSENFYHVIQE